MIIKLIVNLFQDNFFLGSEISILIVLHINSDYFAKFSFYENNFKIYSPFFDFYIRYFTLLSDSYINLGKFF